MKNHQDNLGALPALLRAAGGVDTPKTNSLCCAAAGIIAPSSATAEALIPHKKLRGAALADATLNAQERPLAQPVVGYKHESNAECYPPEAKPGRRYWPADLTDVRPDEWAVMSPKHVAEFGGVTEVWMLLEAAQKRIAELEQVSPLQDLAKAALVYTNAPHTLPLIPPDWSAHLATNQLVTDTQLIEWLNTRGSFWCEFEISQISFPHGETESGGYNHIRDALVEAYQQDQVKLAGGEA